VIPTTLSGIFLFLVALMPGFIFIGVREGHRPTRKLSAFRESATVLVVSVCSYIPFIVIAAAFAFWWPAFNSNLGQALSNPTSYFATHAYRSFVGLGTIVILGSAAAALVGRTGSSGKKVDPRAPAWWQIFSADGDNAPQAIRRLSIYLKDGAVLSGALKSYSREAEEHGDRELVLQEPLYFQAAGAEAFAPLDGTAVIVSAREVQFVEVYLDVQDEGETVATPGELSELGTPN
jgi:hypothetical protein